MGLGPSTEENKDSHNAIAIATVKNLSTTVESKLNYVGIGLIICGIVLIFVLCYVLRIKCKKSAMKWLQKAVVKLPGPEGPAAPKGRAELY